MPILVTTVGLNAIANAGAGGFLIDLEMFSLTPSLAVVLDVEDIQLVGQAVYTAPISNIEAVGGSTIKLTLEVPLRLPETGQWSINEVGVYLKTGELFAHGTFKTPYVKTSEFSMKIYVFVTAGRLGEVINITVSDSSSLPSAAHVRSLLSPSDSLQNVVVVLDENVNTEGDGEPSASLAIKYGQGGLNWAFLGYNKMYTGVPSAVLAMDRFEIDIEQTAGFWLNDNETVLVQVVNGAGAGESRKAQFSKGANLFTILEKPFSALSELSYLSVWRHQSAVLPSRLPSLPNYMVLGAGVNTWVKESVFSSSGTLVQGHIEYTSSGITDYVLPAGIPVSTLGDKNLFTVFVGGALLGLGDYDIFGGVFKTLNALPSGTLIDIYFMGLVAGPGSEFFLFETKYPTDGLQKAFNLPNVPESKAYVKAFLDGIFLPTRQYEVEGARVVFTTAPLSGKTLTLVNCANYDSIGSRTESNRNEWVAGPLNTVFIPQTLLGEKKKTMLCVAGHLVAWAGYDIIEGNLVLKSAPPVGSKVTLFAFTSTTALDVVSTAGSNTGPEWVDPAGIAGLPNTLTPGRLAYLGDGSRRFFDVSLVPNKNHLIVFVEGVYQSPLSYRYLQGVLQFNTPPDVGHRIEVTCFTEADSAGSNTVCAFEDFVMVAGVLAYPTPPISSPEGTFVFVGGVYQHSNAYTLLNGQVAFVSVVAGLKVEVWTFSSKPLVGYRTDINFDYHVMSSTSKYELKKPVLHTANTLVFLSSVFQRKAVYDVISVGTHASVTYKGPMDSNDAGAASSSVSFHSFRPKTRLMLRTEVEADYMPLLGQNVTWDNLSPKLRDMLACPIVKLLGIASGSVDADFSSSNGSEDSILLATKWGLAPLTKSVLMDVIPTANYSAVGSGAALGVPQAFNVYRYLEIYLKDILGTASFAIKQYEQGVKYIIDAITLSAIQTEVIPRAEIPRLTLTTGIFINYPNKFMSTTYPQMPLLSTFLDMKFSELYCVLPAGFADDNRLRTVSVSLVKNDPTQTKTFTHTIYDAWTNSNYTVKWSRPYITVNQNAEYLTLVDSGGAPGYVCYFARLYANYQYNDSDIRMTMYYNKVYIPSGLGPAGTAADNQWNMWIIAIQAMPAAYPATAGYTEGLAFGVTVTDFNSTTGDAQLLIAITSGTIGYSYFPASMLVRRITIPVTYTIYPGINVKPDGTVEPVISATDLFETCCWTGFTPMTRIDNCGTEPLATIQ